MSAPPGGNDPRFSRLRVNVAEFEAFSERHGIPPTRPNEFARTRRGSVVTTLHEPETGAVVVDVLHSERTRSQLEHQDAIARQMAALPGPTGEDSPQQRRAQYRRESLAVAATRYQPPEFPVDVRGHTAIAESFKWTREKGFEQSGSPRSYESGKLRSFSAKEERWLQQRWAPGDPEDTHHSEARFAKAHPKEREDPLVTHQLKGRLDMCATCQRGLTLTTPRGQHVSYVGGEPFNSLEEWKGRKEHFVEVPGTHIARMRPEQLVRHDEGVQREHVEWASEVHRRRAQVIEGVAQSGPSPELPRRRGRSGSPQGEGHAERDAEDESSRKSRRTRSAGQSGSDRGREPPPNTGRRRGR